MGEIRSIHYLGPEGSHTHEAVNQFSMRLGLKSPIYKPEPSIAQAIDAVACSSQENEISAYGCIPLENSIQGSVSQTWDRLFQVMIAGSSGAFGLHAVMTLPIEHYLLSNGQVQLDKISEVFSHPQALAQCKRWLEENMPRAMTIPVSSTAEAARKVSELQTSSQVAIGSQRAASLYGLSISQCSIQDVSNNCTRFGLVANESIQFEPSLVSHFMTSICLVGVSNQPGGLLKALEPFHQNGLNLSRIESRPVGHKLGEYLFYLDIEHSMNPEHDSVVEAWQLVRKILSEKNIDVVPFGTYPVLK